MNNELRATVMMLVVAVGGAGCDAPAAPIGEGPDGFAASAGSDGFAASAGSGGPISQPSDASGDEAGSCNCATVTNATAHQTLSCLCDDGGASAQFRGCGDTLSSYDVGAQCASFDGLGFAGMIRRTGCGKVTYDGSTGLGDQAETFDVVSGALVGVSQDGDTSWGPCSLNSYVYGDVNDDCADVQACFLCGDWNFEKAPPCQ